MFRLYRWVRVVLGIGLVLWIGLWGWRIVQLWWWQSHAPTQTAFMQVRLEEADTEGRRLPLQYQWVEYTAIAPALKRALVVAEDAKFLDHDGFDWEGLEAAYEKNVRQGHIVAGGSTISQQLAKNLFLSPQRTWGRKAEEAVLTVLVEQLLDKNRIFTLYLNTIEWGEGIFGAQAAAQHYFGVSARSLTPWQAAQLAAMVPNPRYYDKHRQDRRLWRKARIIVARMPQAEVPR